ncbi:helix-turn-helix transcriptional regulator [Virgibacillus ainsalahensis]
MEQTRIISAAMIINHSTDLNTYVLDNNANILFHHERITIPRFLPGAEEEDILYFHEQMNMQNKHFYSYVNEWGLRYLGYTTATYKVIIGPYLDLTPNLFSLSRKYHLSSNESENLRSFCNQIQVLTVDKINSYGSILQQFERLIDTDTTPITIAVNGNGKDKRESAMVQWNEDVEIIKVRYRIEADLIHAVELGQKSKAIELLSSNNMLFSFSERFPNQPLRRVKNLAIVLSTLLRTAATRRQVPAILIHRVSEKFANEIEFTNQLSKLQQLYNDMVMEYTDLIVSNALTNYSKLTQRVIEYLVSFYDKQIDKDELASICFTHPSHLSRKFKQETNMTITGYQQMIRINKAKHLLKNEAISIEEIAWSVGYEDASYFARVFKREEGITPSQYREEAW